MNERIWKVICLILSALVLMIPAFVNGYPIVYSDTSTYIISGFELETPFDRPITYGIFLWITSLFGLSLWLNVFFQCLLLAWLIHQLIYRVISNRRNRSPMIALSTVLFLSLFTSVAWTSSQLMPDIFTATMVLSAALILTSAKSNFSFRKLFALYAIFFFSAAMHMGHLSFNVAFLLAIFLLRKLKFTKLKELIALKPIFILLVLSVSTILLMGSAFAKSRNAFFMGALVEHGIAKKYLERHCDTQQYAMCAYKDSLPQLGWEFLWEPDSPFYKMGGWKETRNEFGQIIKGTLTSPEFIALHIKESVKATADQMIRFEIGDGNGSFLEGTQLHERVAHYFPRELPQYESSKQNKKELGALGAINTVYTVVVILSALILIGVVARKERLFNQITLLILLCILVNAWVCGTFANSLDRLGSKMIWLLPMLAIVGLIVVFYKPQSKGLNA